MALDEISNHVEEAGGETRIYCASCGDPDANPPTGYAPPGMVMAMGWQRVSDALVCGDPRCLGDVANLSEEEVDNLLTEKAGVETLSEEAVANMPAPAVGGEFDLSAIPEHTGGEV